VTAIEHGRQDVLMDPPPSRDRLDELLTRYADSVHSDPAPGVVALTLNTRRPPFDSLLARRAFNLAIDRGTVVKLAGGPSKAQATCQLLPPNLPAYRPYCPYTVDRTPGGARDLARAQELVQASGTRGVRVRVLSAPEPALGRYVASMLRQLGYKVSLDVSTDPFLDVPRRRRAEVSYFQWYQDFPAPADFIPIFLGCRTTDGWGDWGDWNLMEFCSPAVDRQMRRALALQASDPTKAYALWSQVDAELVRQAPWVPLYTPRQLTVLSQRVGNYQLHPFWVLMLDQLWVR